MRVREVTIEDFKNVESLKEGHGLGTMGYGDWEHLWAGNRAAGVRRYAMGWVIEDNDEKIVGYLGNILLEYEFRLRRIIAMTGTAFVVEKDYRNYSILLAKNFFSQKNADILLLTTANYEAGRIFSAFHAERPPVASYDTVYFWITNYKGFVSSALSKKKLPLNSMARHTAPFALYGADKIIGRNDRLRNLNVEVRECVGFDERFDIFWHDLKTRYPEKLLYVRDRQHLNWHFRRAIEDKKAWIYICEKDLRITAYAIFLRQDNPGIGLKRVRLVDFQSICEDENVVINMIARALNRCRDEGVHVLETIGFSEAKRSAIERYVPRRRKLPHWPFYYKAEDDTLARELSSPEAWDPCLIDGDACF